MPTCRGGDVVQTLELVCRKSGYPKRTDGDNGSELISPDCFLITVLLQQQAAFRVPERPLVHGPRSRISKTKWLAWAFQ